MAVEGAERSVGKTGSHTTNTRILGLGWLPRTFSIAEAPCKQMIQVGESRISSRTALAD